MKKLASTIASIWGLSIPYFRSEDRWAGRALLGAVIVIELSLVAIQVILNEWYHSRLHCTARRSGLPPPRALPSHLER